MSTALTRREELTATTLTAQNETAIAAVQMQQRTIIEARLTVALKIGRRWDQINLAIARLCRDPDFATEALYAKPIGALPAGWDDMDKRQQLVAAPDEWPRGFSIRFIEALIAEAGHFDITAQIMLDDDDKVITLVTVWDMCQNNAEHRMVSTPKIIERRSVREGQQVMGQRTNSRGKPIYLVRATSAEIETTRLADVSKAKRTLAEKMFRADFRREWRVQVEATIRNEFAKDPNESRKTLFRKFYDLGISPEMIEEYLGHAIDLLQPQEFITLRGIFVALDNSEATWKDVMATVDDGAEDEDRKPTAAEKSIDARIKTQMEREKAKKTPKPAEAGDGQTTQQPNGGPAAAANGGTNGPNGGAQAAPQQQSPAPPPPVQTPWKTPEDRDAAFVELQSALGKIEFDTVLQRLGFTLAQALGDPAKSIQAFDALNIRAREVEAQKDQKRAAAEKPLRDLIAQHGPDAVFSILGRDFGYSDLSDIPMAKLAAVSEETERRLAPPQQTGPQAVPKNQPNDDDEFDQPQPPRRNGPRRGF